MPKLQAWLSLLPGAVNNYTWESDEVKSIIKQIVELSGLDINWLDPYNTEEVLNLITEINFTKNTSQESQEEKQETESLSIQDYSYLTIASLVNAELAVDLESAISIASSIPLSELEGYLKYRLKFLNSDKEREEEERLADENTGKELVEELKTGDYFSGGFSAGLANSLGNC